MPWREVSAMEERREFVRLAMMEGANRRELCRRFGISPPVGYKWLARAEAGDGGLGDRSRRPKASLLRSSDQIEAAVVAARTAHPVWGARKIAALLRREGLEPPAISTVHEILRRHGLVDPEPASPGKAWTRFERSEPNQLWQMDFKGWVRLGGEQCHPLTIVDDHSRFSPCLAACSNQRGETVKAQLTNSFRRYGLPEAFFVDNGNPWGDAGGGERWTRLCVWLLKLGVTVLHSRPYHPQSRGKIERFHRTLDTEVFNLRAFNDFGQVQRAFDQWREAYNHTRPHEALGQQPPASRYRPSPRAMPQHLPQPTYDDGEIVRTVSTTKAYVHFKGRPWRVPRAFCGERLAIRPLSTDGLYGVFFAAHKIATINLTNSQPVSHVSEQVSAMSPV